MVLFKSYNYLAGLDREIYLVLRIYSCIGYSCFPSYRFSNGSFGNLYVKKVCTFSSLVCKDVVLFDTEKSSVMFSFVCTLSWNLFGDNATNRAEKKLMCAWTMGIGHVNYYTILACVQRWEASVYYNCQQSEVPMWYLLIFYHINLTNQLLMIPSILRAGPWWPGQALR